MLMVQFDLHVHSTQFIDSKANHLCDALSRGGDMSGYGVEYNNPDNYYKWDGESAGARAILRCDPHNVDEGSVESSLGLMGHFKGLLDEIQQQGGRPHPTQR